MRPLKLTMNAYGPYAGCTEIDFTKLGENGVYLVAGDTGAGKTTIFDAICYALFDDVSGADRDTKSLRSDFAENSDVASVTLEFIHQGKKYRIKRIPKQERSSQKKKNGVYDNVTIKAEAKLEFLSEDRLPIEKKEDINAEIANNILKISLDQFKQIAMVAQGEFRKLLTAKTEDRVGILRTIFNTSSYNKLNDVLRMRVGSLEKSVKTSSEKINNLFSEIEADSEFATELLERKNREISDNINEDLANFIEAIFSKDAEILDSEREAKKQLDEKVNKLIAEIAIAEKSNEAINKLLALEKESKLLASQKSENEERKEIFDTLKRVVRNIKPIYDEKNKLGSTLNDYRKKLKSSEVKYKADSEKYQVSENEYNKASEKKNEALELHTKVAELKKSENDYIRRDSLRNEVNKLEKAYDEENKQLKFSNTKISQLEEKLNKAHMEENSYAGASENMLNCETKLKEYSRIVKAINKIITAKASVDNYNDEVQKAEVFCINALEAERDITRKVEDAELCIRKNRAGILASTLKSGEPCPVCGSLEHPQLADLSQAKYNDEDVKKLKRQEQAKKDATLKANESKQVLCSDFEHSIDNFLEGYSDIINNIKENSEVFSEALGSIGTESIAIDPNNKYQSVGIIYDELVSINSVLKNIGKQIKTKLESLKNDVKELDNLKQEISKTEELLNNERKHKDALQESVNEYHGKLSSKEGELVAVDNLPYKDVKELRAVYTEKAKQAKEIEDLIAKKQEVVQKLKDSLNNLKGSIETIKNNVNTYSEKLKSAEGNYIQVLSENKFSSDNEIIDYLEKTEEDIAILQEKIDSYERKVSENLVAIEALKDTVQEKELVDIAALKSALGEYQKEQKALEKDINIVQNRQNRNKKLWQEIKAISGKTEKTRHEYSVAKKLYDTFSGQLIESNKIKFEQYVQMTYFDKIIIAGNKRLNSVSNGQYELYRHEVASFKKGSPIDKGGLNLDVLDTLTGKKRPVNTLSGGESFMAALSLALGLSDTVTASMGGIAIDTMFIDEGFGTLDSTSLTSTMNMLLSQTGENKLVGIISHNKELEEMISKQLRVKKGDRGSQIEIDVNAI